MLEKLMKFRKYRVFRPFLKLAYIIIGVDIPNEVIIKEGVKFPHNSYGTVIHPNVYIGKDVKIYQNVTIGRADIYESFEDSNMESIIIEEGAILCAGCKILCKEKRLVIGKNSIVAANAVLLNSTNEGEVWGGIPAKRIK